MAQGYQNDCLNEAYSRKSTRLAIFNQLCMEPESEEPPKYYKEQSFCPLTDDNHDFYSTTTRSNSSRFNSSSKISERSRSQSCSENFSNEGEIVLDSCESENDIDSWIIESANGLID